MLVAGRAGGAGCMTRPSRSSLCNSDRTPRCTRYNGMRFRAVPSTSCWDEQTRKEPRKGSTSTWSSGASGAVPPHCINLGIHIRHASMAVSLHQCVSRLMLHHRTPAFLHACFRCALRTAHCTLHLPHTIRTRFPASGSHRVSPSRSHAQMPNLT